MPVLAGEKFNDFRQLKIRRSKKVGDLSPHAKKMAPTQLIHSLVPITYSEKPTTEAGNPTEGWVADEVLGARRRGKDNRYKGGFMSDLKCLGFSLELQTKVEGVLGLKLPDNSSFSLLEDGGISVHAYDGLRTDHFVEITKDGEVYRSISCSEQPKLATKFFGCYDLYRVKQNYSIHPDKLEQAQALICANDIWRKP